MKTWLLFGALLTALGVSAQVPDNYTVIGPYREGAWIVSENNRQGVYDEYAGLLITPCRYDSVGVPGHLHPEWALVRLKGKLGMLDYEGFETVPAEYDAIGKFGERIEHMSIVRNKGKYGVVNGFDGIGFVPARYDSIGTPGAVVPRQTVVGIKGKYGLYSLEEMYELVKCEYEHIGPSVGPYEDMVIVTQKGKKGVITTWGSVTLRCEFDEIRFSDRNTFLATRDGVTTEYTVEGSVYEE